MAKDLEMYVEFKKPVHSRQEIVQELMAGRPIITIVAPRTAPRGNHVCAIIGIDTTNWNVLFANPEIELGATEKYTKPTWINIQNLPIAPQVNPGVINPMNRPRRAGTDTGIFRTILTKYPEIDHSKFKVLSKLVGRGINSRRLHTDYQGANYMERISRDGTGRTLKQKSADYRRERANRLTERYRNTTGGRIPPRQ